ncbi:pilus assembly protein PilM [[Erwinia] mediterraneensis]|uniref:pilus assembly protein PilM n=1 Tax=[Erwinia] mediterraneensis TaxID=2161819 RepID=UPI00102F7D68|nr:pilus assembly protein PilM [[Erwinia] mediterraneensis]
MAFQMWQIGLDIQNGQLCALGIQRRREGWQLRHWWQQPLAQDTLRNGVLQSSAWLLEQLQQWRKQLPQRISLRVGLGPQLVLQRPLALPEQSLREPELSRYVHAAAKRLFPIEPEALALDYRPLDHDTKQLYVTAARRAAIARWLEPLRQAGLLPEVFELTPMALAIVAREARLPSGSVLVHQLSDHWLWYIHDDDTAACSSGFCDDIADFSQLQQRHFPAARQVWFSAASATPAPAGTLLFSPFALLQHVQPPLPSSGHAFTLALGLAMRRDDR